MRRLVVPAAVVMLVSGCASSSADLYAQTSGVVIPAENLAAHLRARVGSLVAECMVTAGYPEMRRAQEMRPEVESRSHSGVVYWHPLESGPTTRDEARQLGLLGLSLSFQEPLPGDVISGLPAFDQALDRCGDLVVADDTVVSDRLDAWTLQANEIRGSFMNEAFDDLRPLLVEQMECLADAAGFEFDGDLPRYEHVLSDLGIDEGRWRTYSAPAVVPGQVLVAARAPTRYFPSDREIAVALQFVECAEKVEFFARLEADQRPARDRTLDLFDAQIDEFEMWATSAVESLSD